MGRLDWRGRLLSGYSPCKKIINFITATFSTHDLWQSIIHRKPILRIRFFFFNHIWNMRKSASTKSKINQLTPTWWRWMWPFHSLIIFNYLNFESENIVANLCRPNLWTIIYTSNRHLRQLWKCMPLKINHHHPSLISPGDLDVAWIR